MYYFQEDDRMRVVIFNGILRKIIHINPFSWYNTPLYTKIIENSQ